VRFGAKLRNYGARATMATVLDEARRAEDAGFDSVWLSDHVAMPDRTRSCYPYGDGGEIDWDVTEPWLEPVVLLAALAAVTSRARLGTAVLVACLREPVGLAKQLACITQLCGGRLVLGLGDGWLREELELFGAEFGRRRELTDRIVDVCREVWSGVLLDPRSAGALRFHTTPVPLQEVPVLLGGASEQVLRRVASRGYGWLPLHRGQGAAAHVRDGLARIDAWRSRVSGTSGPGPQVVLNAGRAEEIADELPALAAAGVTEVLIDGEFDVDGGPERALELARDASSGRARG